MNSDFGNRKFVGDFLIGKTLGRGGFGTVYLGVNVRTGDKVAIKVLRKRPGPSGLGFQQQVKHFEREAQLCSGLQHSHLVRLLDHGRIAPQSPYAIYEYLPGETLRQALSSRRRLPASVAIEILFQVLSGVTYAHRHHVIHCDIKPDNIMVTGLEACPQAKLFDFGAGRQFGNDAAPSSTTRPHRVAVASGGTPRYCAPEQILGASASPAVDLYAWGVVFVEAITGHASANVPAHLRHHALGQLLAQVLEKDARIRKSSANDTLHQLVELREMPLPDACPPSLTVINGSNQETRETLLNKSLNNANRHRAIAAICLSLDVFPKKNQKLDLALLDAQQAAQQTRCTRVFLRSGAMLVSQAQDEAIFYFEGADDCTLDAGVEAAARAAFRVLSLANSWAIELEHDASMVMSLRLGLHCGFVPTIDGCARIDGAIPSSAKRLAFHAEANSILASHDVQQLLPSSFQSEKSTERVLSRTGAAAATHRLVSFSALGNSATTDSTFQALSRKRMDTRHRHNVLMTLGDRLQQATEAVQKQFELLHGRNGALRRPAQVATRIAPSKPFATSASHHRKEPR